MFAGNSLWHLIAQTDSITKTVLFILLVMSIICWTVFLCKLLLFYIKKRDLRAMVTQLKTANSVDELMNIASRNTGTLSGYFVSHNLNFFLSILNEGPQQRTQDSVFAKATPDRLREATPGMTIDHRLELERMYYHLEQSIEQLTIEEERYIPVLSTSAAVSPLLGLFGTVWGLIHAFIGISEAQAADIATIAPGIAEALTTTLAGLMVAIPALVMGNYLMVQVQQVEKQLVRLSDFVSRICTSHLYKMEKVCVDLPASGEKELQ